MSQRFAEGAQRLARLAGRMLGWPPHWFWRATPGELAVVLLDEANAPEGGITRERLRQMMESEKNG